MAIQFWARSLGGITEGREVRGTLSNSVERMCGGKRLWSKTVSGGKPLGRNCLGVDWCLGRSIKQRTQGDLWEGLIAQEEKNKELSVTKGIHGVAARDTAQSEWVKINVHVPRTLYIKV